MSKTIIFLIILVVGGMAGIGIVGFGSFSESSNDYFIENTSPVIPKNSEMPLYEGDSSPDDIPLYDEQSTPYEIPLHEEPVPHEMDSTYLLN